MPRPTVPVDIREALQLRQLSTVTVWNRLEGRPRTLDFDRALRAETRDALWFLTKQWQMGEFEGDDAGSPALVKLQARVDPLTRYQAADGQTEPFENQLPLEAVVERIAPPFTVSGIVASLDLRLAMGRYWLKLLGSLGAFDADYIAVYPISAPDPALIADATRTAHSEVWSQYAAVAGRRMDGWAFYQHITTPGNHAADGISGLAGRVGEADALANRFLAWFKRWLLQPPATGDGWDSSRFGYRFECAAGTDVERTLLGEGYRGGRLDWYDVDLKNVSDPPAPANGAASATSRPVLTMLPVPVTFDGMPDTRWWAFEDRKTNFGNVKPDTTDIAKLLIIEFALSYANDWFVIPLDLPVGSLIHVEGLAVTNVFGERTWITAAGSGADEDWQRWAMWNLSTHGDADVAADTGLLLLPVAPKALIGEPEEEVLLIRDENANMVWAIEKKVLLAHGESKPGEEAALELHAWIQQDLDRRLDAMPPLPPDAPIAPVRYDVMSPVPENWIPFIPVHVDGSSRAIQLQRAAMPRILERDPDKPLRIQPRTNLLRVGLDGGPSPLYFVHEEEVPRAGARVRSTFHRTRWRGGKAVVWLGNQRGTGRGEGWSGLAFDRLVST